MATKDGSLVKTLPKDLAMLCSWESEDDIDEYAIFEALMEGPGGSTSAASSTLERNKNRVRCRKSCSS